jgi:hypothetical protein
VLRKKFEAASVFDEDAPPESRFALNRAHEALILFHEQLDRVVLQDDEARELVLYCVDHLADFLPSGSQQN